VFERKGGRLSGLTRTAIAAGLLAVLGFRIYFGLHAPPVIIPDDEVQVYLIGLKSYTTHTWPAFGTDLSLDRSGAYRGQMAGALQGLLVALPLYVWPAPASPYVFLNLLTFAGLTFFGWYCCRRLPGFPRWWIFLWLYVAPWNLHFSTTMINQSYSALGGVLFVVGFLESLPSLRVGAIPVRWANVLMGFGVCWVQQLHMSWVMLCPLAAYSLFEQWRAGRLRAAIAFAGLGAVPLLALIVPTWLAYGFTTGRDLEGHVSLFDLSDIVDVLVVLGRFLSFASFELPRFLGPGLQERLAYLRSTPWLTAPGFLLWGIGLLQPLALIVIWFVRAHPRPDWRAMKHTTLGAFLTIYVLFWFSGRTPGSFRFAEILPLVMLYSFYCWDYLAARRAWRVAGVVFLAAAVCFQAGYALKSAHHGGSVYDQNRDRMARAIAEKNYHLLAERRSFAIY
jgi:hypothetical protein